jgi:molecular chaperone GrpE
LSKKEKPIDPEVVETPSPAVEQPETKVEEETAKLASDLEAAQKAVEETKDQLLRTLAEYDNFRKRTEKEKAAIYDHAVKDAVSQILNVADSMEMALAHKDCEADDLRKGVEMIDKSLKDALSKLKVEAIGAVGDTFDPSLHQAVSHIEDENLGENVIAQVYQKGYRIGDKMIRHATVVVAN